MLTPTLLGSTLFITHPVSFKSCQQIVKWTCSNLTLKALGTVALNGSRQHSESVFLRGGWSGGAKVLYILHHWGVQLILAYSWARPAILVVGNGRGGMFLFLLFLHFHSFLPLSFISSTLSSISFLPFSGRRHKMTLKGWRVVKPQHNQNQFSWENRKHENICYGTH